MGKLEQIKYLLILNMDDKINNILVPPTITTGAIIWGIILRSAIVIISSLILIFIFRAKEIALLAQLFLWFWVVYPAYNQYTQYNKRIEALKTETLCGKCKHFVEASQLCAILDEHVGLESICEGASWEPSSDIFSGDD